MTGFTRFQEIMNEDKEKECDNPIILEKIQNNIEFIDVSFKYKSRDHELDDEDQTLVLDKVSFNIPVGTTLALVAELLFRKAD
jgi:ABC-type multidrug transport system fused ATPase/permease subunit